MQIYIKSLYISYFSSYPPKTVAHPSLVRLVSAFFFLDAKESTNMTLLCKNVLVFPIFKENYFKENEKMKKTTLICQVDQICNKKISKKKPYILWFFTTYISKILLRLSLKNRIYLANLIKCIYCTVKIKKKKNKQNLIFTINNSLTLIGLLI